VPRPSATVVLGFAFVVLAWGFNYPFLRLGTEFSPPAFLVFLRALAGILVMIPLIRIVGWHVTLSRAKIAAAVLIGSVGYGAFLLLWGYAAASVPPGEASVLIYLFPIWVLLLSLPLLQRVPTPLQLTGVLLGFLGVVLVSGIGTRGLGGSPVDLLLLAGAGLCWAIATVLSKRTFEAVEMVAANAWQLASGTALLAAVSFATEPWGGIRWTADLLGVLVWTGALGTGVAYVIWYYLLGRGEAGPLSAYTFLVVVVALVGSIAFFHESIDALQLVGVATILVGLYLVGAPRVLVPSAPIESGSPGGHPDPGE
jgi:drug/metabolite transporter (DMT)-like permease